MDIIQYLFRLLYRIRWWILIGPILVTLAAIIGTRRLEKSFPVDMTIYTGIVSGFGVGLDEGNVQNSTVVNNTIDNIINIMLSKETLREVSLHLYARHMIHGDPVKDNKFITAENYRELQRITPLEVKALIDKTSEINTVSNLKEYENASPTNFVYGLFNWNHPHYSFISLKKIKVERLGSSDMLRVSYSANDPGVAYQTLLLLDIHYANVYQSLQFGSTSSAIRYFEGELARAGKELRESEDSLTDYNIRNRIINYDEQTKQVAALDRDLDLMYQDILLEYNSSEASLKHLETQLDENTKFLMGNADFLKKLKEVSELNTRVAEMEAFYTDTIVSTYPRQQLIRYKQKLEEAEDDLINFSHSFTNSKYTSEGYPTSNFVVQWLEELLKLEKTKSEKTVVETFKMELDNQYSHFSPIGSTIKRQERNIDFIERNYLTILNSLNAARLRLKSLEMNSASLKLINPPVFPLNAEPSKRKVLILGSYVVSFVFLLGFFLLFDLLDHTLRDRLRTEHITGAKVIAALPGKVKQRQRKYSSFYQKQAIRSLANGIQNYFESGNLFPIVNVISMEANMGKTLVADLLSDYWSSQGVFVQVLRYGRDFDPSSSDFLFANGIHGFMNNLVDQKKIITIVEHAPISYHTIPKIFLREATFNLLLVRADMGWAENNKQLFTSLLRQSDATPIQICLNHAEKEVVEGFTGMLPPFSNWRRLFYRFSQLAFTASEK